MAEVVLLLGGNIGDVGERLKECRAHIAANIGEIESLSVEMQSEAWGFSSSELFVNQAVRVITDLSPTELLLQTQRIEQQVGRNRTAEIEQKRVSGERYASRVIDVDIISYDQEVINSDQLVIPHPRMQEREFVLKPMAEVAPQWSHPLLNKTTVELLENIK